MQVIQFIHPGQEYPVSDTNSEKLDDNRYDVHWNTGRHHRRLVKKSGDYIDNDGNLHQNEELVFWTEWEAPTVASPLNGVKDAIHARYLHEIQYPAVPVGMENSRRNACDEDDDGCEEGLQNTDPCVFGATFKYSNCQQAPNGILRWLDPGSLVLFVSRIKGKYYLDTVFVAETRKEYSTDRIDSIDCSEIYRTLTLGRLSVHKEFTFYRGVGFKVDAPIYSFVPARPHTGAADDYVRCRLDVNRINGVAGAGCEVFSLGLTQKFKCTVADTDLIQRVWQEVVRQVRECGFVLGTHFDWPQP